LPLSNVDNSQRSSARQCTRLLCLRDLVRLRDFAVGLVRRSTHERRPAIALGLRKSSRWRDSFNLPTYPTRPPFVLSCPAYNDRSPSDTHATREPLGYNNHAGMSPLTNQCVMMQPWGDVVPYARTPGTRFVSWTSEGPNCVRVYYSGQSGYLTGPAEGFAAEERCGHGQLARKVPT
jgi:hypothetical protein